MPSISTSSHPSQPEEVIPPLDAPIPDTASDRPPTELILKVRLHTHDTFHLSHTNQKPAPNRNDLPLPAVVLGCATFGFNIYAEQSACLGPEPVRVVRYALRAGINAFDTSPFYHPSELVLGRALSLLENEFPRNSYTLITKVGKYGAKVREHDYEPATIRASVERSLKRLGTDYLDVVYLHDVEFVASPSQPGTSGHHLDALSSLNPDSGSTKEDTFHLAPPYRPLGAGDETILSALSVLRDLQSQGKIRRIGISGYPLPVLLRISLVALHTAPFQPLDIIQTYAHQTILNDSLAQGYLDTLTEKAGVGQLMNAAPLAMGLLTDSGGPLWHPLRQETGGIFEATREAAELCRERGAKLEVVASEFGFRELRQKDGKLVPVVIGCKNMDEVTSTLESHRDANGEVKEVGKEVMAMLEKKGVRGYSWANPHEDTFRD